MHVSVRYRVRGGCTLRSVSTLLVAWGRRRAPDDRCSYPLLLAFIPPGADENIPRIPHGDSVSIFELVYFFLENIRYILGGWSSIQIQNNQGGTLSRLNSQRLLGGSSHISLATPQAPAETQFAFGAMVGIILLSYVYI